MISNAIFGGDDAEWTLPTARAFTSEEIKVIVNWVRAGGSLLLIADHMPFPGGTEDLADEFGIIFLNGFAMKSFDGGGTISFTRSSGSHAFTGRLQPQTFIGFLFREIQFDTLLR